VITGCAFIVCVMTYYALELSQYESRPYGVLPDTENLHSICIVDTIDGEIAGFIGITPPSSLLFSVDRYLHRNEITFMFDHRLSEIRALTVLRSFCGRVITAYYYQSFLGFPTIEI